MQDDIASIDSLIEALRDVDPESPEALHTLQNELIDLARMLRHIRGLIGEIHGERYPRNY